VIITFSVSASAFKPNFQPTLAYVHFKRHFFGHA